MRYLRAIAFAVLAGASAAAPAYDPLRGFDPQLALGVGHVRPVNEKDREDWLFRLRLQVFDAPGGRARTVSGLALESAVLETGYETTSLIVREARPDGWLRLHLGKEGAGWVRAATLESTVPPLAYEPWEKLFVGGEISPIYFRVRKEHALRARPADTSAALVWIPADPNMYAIVPLEIVGDWARVRYTSPSDYCFEPKPKPKPREGWIRWRELSGPAVWYYTRGC